MPQAHVLVRPPQAWVTGSSSGIGAAIAQRLLHAGWAVQGWDRAAPTLGHARFSAHSVDLADAASTEALLVQQLVHGPPDALVHAAGVMRAAPLGDLSAEDGELQWQLHVQAATRLANVVLPAMAQRGHGRCVLIGSRVWRGLAGRSQYAATKAALVSLPRPTPAMPAGASAADTYAALTRDQWQTYVSTFVPIENQLIQYATDRNRPLQAMADASKEVTESYAAQEGAVGRQLRGLGVSLSGDEQAAQTRALGLSKSLADVGAQNMAHDLTVQRQQSLLGNPAPASTQVGLTGAR